MICQPYAFFCCGHRWPWVVSMSLGLVAAGAFHRPSIRELALALGLSSPFWPPPSAPRSAAAPPLIPPGSAGRSVPGKLHSRVFHSRDCSASVRPQVTGPGVESLFSRRSGAPRFWSTPAVLFSSFSIRRSVKGVLCSDPQCARGFGFRQQHCFATMSS